MLSITNRRYRASDVILFVTLVDKLMKIEDDSDYKEFSVEPYMYEPEFSDSQSDFSESNSGSEESFADALDDHRFFQYGLDNI